METRGKLTKIDLAYAAGLFDGEGHVIIYKDVNRKIGKNPTYILIVGCTNTDRKLIDFLYKRWGASYQIRKDIKHPEYKICYEWTIQAKKAINFLKDIFPYLIGKKEKAKLAIEFQKGLKCHFDKKGKVIQTSLKEIERREQIWKKLNLHKKKK